MEIPLTDGLVLRGRVVDESGNGIRGAKVRSAWGGVSYGYTKSAGDGQFAMSGVDPGVFEVEASCNGYLPSSIDRGSIDLGLSSGSIDIVLPRGLTIEGAVTMPDGRPVMGAKVTALGRTAYAIQNERGPHATTDAKGRFAIGGLAPGPRRLIATAAFDVAPGSQTTPAVHATEQPIGKLPWRAEHERAEAGEDGIELVLGLERASRESALDRLPLPVRVDKRR